ncbi:MAG: flagellin [Oscillospiraceae bacterium]|nr:flagellin [Oscillospiraceae bacterium]
MRIQHNIAAMNAYRNYNINTSAVSKNLEKLSSGYKINRAGDDAAGLAISEKMRAQISGLNAASKNAKDGVSLVKTAEGALQEVHDMLNRMVTLATQSANGTYDNQTDRYQLQKEVNQLKAEIDRIADSSNFNGINLLDGSMSTDGVVNTFNNVDLTAVLDAKDAQVAAKGKFQIDMSQSKWVANQDNATVDFNFGGVDVSIKLGKAGDAVTGATVAQAFVDEINKNGGGGADAGKIKIGGKEFTVTQDKGVITFSGVDTSVFTSGNGVDAGTKLTVTADGAGTVSYWEADETPGNQGYAQDWKMIEEPVSDIGNLLAQATFELADDGVAISDGTTIKIGDQTYTFAVGKNSQFKNSDSDNIIDLTDYEANDDTRYVAAAARLTQAAKNNTAVDVSYDANTGKIYLTEKAGGIDRNVYDLFGSKTSAATGSEKDATWKSVDRSLVQVGQASMNGKALTLQIGDTSDSYNQLNVNIKDCHAAAIGIGSIDISTQKGAQAAVDSIKNAINYVSDVRGTLGATQNRLDHTINNLSVMTENIQDAESTIRDTDVAEEMMAYTKNNILVQSAQAMLAQANQIPQGVLQLLG